MRNFLLALLTCSAAMSAVALILIALTPVLRRRYTEAARYYAWLVILLGLIIPFRPQTNFALVRVTLPGEVQAPIMEAITPHAQDYAPQPGAVWAAQQTVETAVRAPRSIPWWNLAAAIWGTGAAAFLIHHAITHIRFTKMLARWREPVADDVAIALWRGLKADMHIPEPIRLFRCAGIASPMMTGFIRPGIYLPIAEYDPTELRLILTHELIHYRRKDLWFKALKLVAMAMHWFNPVMPFIAREIDAQCELSCDDAVIKGADMGARQQYGEAIIGVIRRQSRLNTALSTNFYGGKRGMKKRIYSIMDTRKKRTGIVVICAALVMTIATGMAFAAGENRPTATAVEQSVAEQARVAAAYDSRFEKYTDFGIIYDQAADLLTYHGEPVRYFEDFYPVDEAAGAYAGTSYFNEDGAIDVHGIRDVSNLIQNADGSYDPSGKLLGVAPFTQAEFAALNVQSKTAMTVANTDIEPQAAASASTAPAESVAGSNFALDPDSQTSFQEYAPFGLTYESGTNVFYYRDKLVRRFVDELGTLAFTREVPDDFDLSVDLTAIRDENGNLTGIVAADKAEFDERSERLMQSRKEWEAFYQDHPWVSDASIVETQTEYGATNEAEPDSAYDDAPVTETRVVYESAQSEDALSDAPAQEYNASASIIYDAEPPSVASIEYDYIDTSLDAYLDYGVSYDQATGRWLYQSRPIALLDDDNRLASYVYLSADDRALGFEKYLESTTDIFLKVIRSRTGAITELAQLTPEEIEQRFSMQFVN